MSVHQLKDGRWICKLPDPTKPGGSRREYFGRGPAAESKARARDRSLDLKRTRPAAGDTGPTFFDLSVAYMEHKDFSLASAYRVESVLSSAITPAIGAIKASRMTHADLDNYVAMRRKSVKNTTIGRELTVIQAIMNWAAQRKPPMIPANPLKGFSPPKSDAAVILPPTPAEVAAILQNANERLNRFIKLAWYTGLRPGSAELLSLTWDLVLWDTGVIRIISAQKGGIQMREVPIHPGFLAELKSWHDADLGIKGTGHIIQYCGHRITRIQEAWRIAKEKAGITRRLRLYDLRHFFVTSAIEAGADWGTLSAVVGSSPETLRRHYQHVSSAARVRLIENMPKLPGNFDRGNL